jgi:hypothetical protein
MSATITINLDDTYDLQSAEKNLTLATFNSYDRTGNPVLLKIRIKPVKIDLLSDVYNLSFGPPKADGTIDDMSRIGHQNPNKMFSTIILFSLAFLQDNPGVTIGLDGSNDVRAYMYHRMFLTNKTYLADYFVTLGVDWFVKLLRNNDIERRPDNSPFFKPRSEPFDYQRIKKDLYRYYMYHLKDNSK